jgi:FG-GAP-like repeat
MKPLLFIFALHAVCLHAEPLSREVITVPGAPWKRHTIDSTSKGADGVKLGDFNRDGLPDIVTGWEEGGVVRIYANPGPAKAREPWPQTTVGEVKSVEEAIFADLDGDGRLEVVSGAEGKTRTLYWHRELEGKWRTDAFSAAKGTQMWMQAAALDLDGQHGADLLLASKGEGAAVGWLQAPAKADDLAAWSYHVHPSARHGWRW